MRLDASELRVTMLGCALVILIGLNTSKAISPPPGFEVVPLTTDGNQQSDYMDNMDINNCGVVVYDRRINRLETWEIFYYENGRTVQLTDDPDHRVVGPDINDAGQMVWARGGNRGSLYQVVLYENGQERLLADDPNTTPHAPHINNLGHVTWQEVIGWNCRELYKTMFYDGNTTREITDHAGGAGLADQIVKLNDYDEISFCRYDWCADYEYNGQRWWTSNIMYYDIANDILVNITGPLFGDPGQHQGSGINNFGDVAFEIQPFGSNSRISVWHKQDGSVTEITDGSIFEDFPYAINNKGDIAFARWNEFADGWETWVYFGGALYRVQSTGWLNFPDNINEAGEMVFTYATVYDGRLWSDAYLMRRIRTGDMDLDLDVDEADYVAFAQGFTGEGDFEGLCAARFADIDHDRDVDCDDWELFKSNWSGEGDPPPLAPCACNGRERIAKAKCVIRDSAVSKAVAIVKNAAPGQEYTATLDTGQTLARVANDRGRVRFVFRRANKPPCGPNGASVCGLHESFGCDC